MTILFADMVGYSRWVEEDEARTLEFMAQCFDTLHILTRRHDCTLVKTMGDGALLVFEDAGNAISYGLEFHRIVAKTQRGASRPYMFRIGVHLGEVTWRDGDVFGSAVNIAQRVQTEAPPGSCIVTRHVRDAVAGKTQLGFVDIGAPALRNIPKRITLYRVLDASARVAASGDPAASCVNVIGPLSLRLGESPAVKVSGALVSGLLGYLALCPGRLALRDQLAELFWPGRERASARRALRQAVVTARRQLRNGPDILRQDRNWVAIEDAGLETDLERIEADLRRGVIAPRLLEDGRWPEMILAGSGAVAPGFAAWLHVVREAWRRRIGQGLEGVIEREPAMADAFGSAASALLLLEPGNEIASYARISHDLARGNRAAALAEFDRLKGYLARTYGTAPGQRIREAIQAAMDGSAAPGGLPRQTEVRRRRLLRIAVLPFAGGSGSYRIPAFHAELVANLSRFRDWSVLEPAAPANTPPAVDFEIAGDAAMEGGTLHLMLRLHKLPEGRVLWSDQVHIGGEGWEQAQHDVLHRITAELESYISADRLAAALDRRGAEPTLHDSWLRGDSAMMHWTAQGMEEAREIFAANLREDPDHVPSLTSLASMSNIQHLIWPGRVRSGAETAEADRLASRAAQIDPLDSRVHRVVAWTAAFNGAFDRASLHLDRARDLNPNSPVTLASCALGWAWFGEREKSDITITRLLTITSNLAPWLWSYLSVAYFFLDRLGDARRTAEMSDDTIIDNKGWIAAIEARGGDMAAAEQAFGEMVERVTPLWLGKAPATPATIAAWFTNAYPVRNAALRAKLAEPIEAVLARI